MSIRDGDGTVGVLDPAAEELVVVEQTGSRATVTLNDPMTLNALSQPLTASLHQTLQQLVDMPELRAIVLTGAEGAFSSGGECGDPAAAGVEGFAGLSGRTVRRELGEVARLIAHSNMPFVAAVNGVAAGAGLALALVCDVVLVSDRARLAPAAGRVGLRSEVGVSWLLTRRLGYHRAISLFSGVHELSAAQAARGGLVEAAVAHDELALAVSFWCEIAALSATRDMAKSLVRSATESGRVRAAVMEEFAASCGPPVSGRAPNEGWTQGRRPLGHCSCQRGVWNPSRPRRRPSWLCPR